MNISASPLAGHYEFLQHEKISRAHIGIADRYFIRGDKESAKKFYTLATKPETTNKTILSIAALADQTFEQLSKQRQGLFDGLVAVIADNSYAGWCGKRNGIQTGTLIDVAAVREAISSDFHLEGIFGDHPPISPTSGWVDPLPPETEFIDYASITPASVFKADTAAGLDVDVGIPAFGDKDNPIRASVAMPIIANVLTAKVGLFAIETGLTLTGQAQGTVPIFHYEYVQNKAKGIIAHIQDIESRMLPIQFELDVNHPTTNNSNNNTAIPVRLHNITFSFNIISIDGHPSLRWKPINNGVLKCFVKYPNYTLEITKSPSEGESVLEIHLSDEYVFDPLKGLLKQYDLARHYASLAAQRLRLVISDNGNLVKRPHMAFEHDVIALYLATFQTAELTTEEEGKAWIDASPLLPYLQR